MKVEGVNLYHIGIKLDSGVKISELQTAIQDFCSVEGYEMKEQQKTGLLGGVLPVELNTGILEVGAKDGVSIQLNFVAKALNTIGKDPAKVTEAFKKISTYLHDNKKYEVLAELYEVIMEASLSNSKTPREILNANTNVNLSALNEKVGTSGVCGMHIKSEGSIFEGKEAIDIILEPHPVRPSKEFYVRLIWHTKDSEKLINFNTEVDGILTSILT